MLIVFIAIFFAMAVIVKSYKHIDNNQVSAKDVLIAGILGALALTFMILRQTYFALPEEGMVSIEYLTYRKYLLWGFIALMAYIVRFFIYGSVYIYKNRKSG